MGRISNVVGKFCVVLLVIGVSGCGGGGSSPDTSSTSTSTPTPDTVPEPTGEGLYDGIYDFTYQYMTIGICGDDIPPLGASLVDDTPPLETNVAVCGPGLRSATAARYIEIKNGQISSGDGAIKGYVGFSQYSYGNITIMFSGCPGLHGLGVMESTGIYDGDGGLGAYRCLDGGDWATKPLPWLLTKVD